MVTASEGENATKGNWFLKRTGFYVKDIEINIEDGIILGRGLNKGVQYSIGVSRKHALLKKTVDDHWTIIDLGSTNGLFINAIKVTAGHFECIKEFDIIGLGVADACRDEHFSFMLCQRPELELSEGNLVEQDPEEDSRGASSPSKSCPIKSTENIISELGNGKTSRNSFKLDVSKDISQSSEKQIKEDVNLKDEACDSHNSAVNVVPKAEDNDVCILFQIIKYKRKRKEVIILPDDSSDDDIVHIPRNRCKLRKIKHIVEPCGERTRGNTCEVVVPNSFNKEENFIKQQHTSSGVMSLQYSDQYKQPNGINSTDVTLSTSQGVKVKQEPELKHDFLLNGKVPDFHPAVDSLAISNENLCSDEQTEYCIKSASNFDANAIIYDDEKLVHSQTDNFIMISDNEDLDIIKHKPNELKEKLVHLQTDNVIMISDNEDLDIIKHKQNELNIERECADEVDVSIKKEPGDICPLGQKQKIEKSIGQQSDDVYDTGINDGVPAFETLDDTFDFGNKTDFGIEEKEMFGRLVWPPTPDDWNKENVSQTSIDTDVRGKDAEKKHSQHTKSKLKESSPTQIKSGGNCCHISPIKLTKALPIQSHTHNRGPSLKEKIRKNEQYQIPCPVGRSAIRKDDSSNKLKRNSSNRAINHQTSWSRSINATVKILPLANNNIHSIKKSKNIPNAHVQRFTSRTELLLQSMLLNSSLCDRKKFCSSSETADITKIQNNYNKFMHEAC